MKLLKFNLIFIPFLALCLGTVGYIARDRLLEDAREHVIQNARIIMETMLSSRTYTTKQVAPLLEQKNFKLQTAISEFRKAITEIPKAPDHPWLPFHEKTSEGGKPAFEGFHEGVAFFGGQSMTANLFSVAADKKEQGLVYGVSQSMWSLGGLFGTFLVGLSSSVHETLAASMPVFFITLSAISAIFMVVAYNNRAAQ